MRSASRHSEEMTTLPGQEATNGFRLETELLLACAQSRPRLGQAEPLYALLRRGVDWPRLLRLARRQGMLPMLYRQLSAAGPEHVPADVLAALDAQFRANAGRNLQLTAELVRVLALFEQHGLSAIPWKGPVLATALYGNLALREFSDLDLLVRRPDVPKAEVLLASLGYAPKLRVGNAQKSAYLRSGSEYGFVSSDGAVLLELHWALVPRSYALPFDIGGLWARAETLILAGATVLTLAAEDLLLTLCVHAATHGWASLAWLADVARLIERYPAFDWDAALHQARRLGSERLLLLGALLAAELLAASVPAAVVSAARASGAVLRLAAQARKNLFGETGGRFEGTENYLFWLGCRDRLTDRLRCSIDRLASPTEEDLALFELPPAFFPLYYAVRPLRLAAKHGRLALRKERPAWGGQESRPDAAARYTNSASSSIQVSFRILARRHKNR